LKNWKKGTGRFQAYGKRFDPSTGTATSHSAGDQETSRAAQVPNTDVADTSSETNGSVSNASRKQSLSTEDMIKIFQNHESFTKQGNSLTQLGEMLKLEVSTSGTQSTKLTFSTANSMLQNGRSGSNNGRKRKDGLPICPKPCQLSQQPR